MATLDAWNDDNWEVIADREAATAADSSNKASGNPPSSGSSIASGTSNATEKPAPAPKSEEDNRKLWVTANSTISFEILPSGQAKSILYKPELKILKRAAAAPVEQPQAAVQTETPLIDRKEKERRYQEARERLFGPSASATGSSDANSASSTPTAGMSRSSSSTGIGGPGSNQSTAISRGSSASRGSKRGGNKASSGLSTPRNKSPNRSGNADVEKVERPIGGIVKKTGNGWIYKADSPGTNASPAPSRLRIIGNEKPDAMANLSKGLTTMNLAGEDYSYFTYASTGTVAGVWGTAVSSTPWQQPGQQNLAHTPAQPGHTFPPFGTNSHSPQPQQNYYSQPTFPQYSRHNPNSSTPNQQHNYMQSQSFYQHTPYQQSTHTQNPYMQPHGLHPQQCPYPNSNLYQPSVKAQSHPNPTPLSSQSSLQSAYYPDGQTSRVVYIQDPNSFAPRPPPPKGTLNPGFNSANHTDEQAPFREPKGPDGRGGRGFLGRGGKGGGFTEGGNAG